MELLFKYNKEYILTPLNLKKTSFQDNHWIIKKKKNVFTIKILFGLQSITKVNFFFYS